MRQRIRAAQGHTIELAAAILQPVEDARKVPLAIHVTSAANWEKIKESGALRRMGRSHVHFATEPRHKRLGTCVPAT